MSWRSRSYEVLPAISVRRAELRKSLRVVTVAWMFGIVWMSCAYGSHVKSFARMLGFTDRAFGIMSAIPWLAAIGQIIATIIIERTGLRKFHFIHVMIVNRALWLLLPLIPLVLPVPSTAAVVTMLAILGLSRFMAALGMPAWWSWMGDLIPRRIRGRYLAQRDRLCKIVQVVTAIALGFILDAVTVEGAEDIATQPRLMVAACVIFLVGAVFGVIDILMFLRIREVIPTVADKPRPPAVNIRVAAPDNGTVFARVMYGIRYVPAALKDVLGDPMKDRFFRRYTAYGMMMTFAMTAGGWYFWLLALEHLGFSKLGTNVLFLAVGPLAGIVSAKAWGKLLDRWGRRPVLLIATAGLMVSILPWFFASPQTPHPQFVATAVNWLSWNIGGLFGRPTILVGPTTPLGAFMLIFLNCTVSGPCWLGVFLCQNSIMLGFADGHGRSKYVAAAAVVMGVGGVLGGLVAGEVTQRLGFLRDAPIGPFLWNNWHAAVVLSLLARMAAMGLALRMPDPGAGRARDMFRLMGGNFYSAVAPWLFLPLRLIRWRRRNNNGSGRSR